MDGLTIRQKIWFSIRTCVYYFINSIFSIIPKKKNLVLFSAWFGQKYIDNTRYVYEYLLFNSDYKVLWLTKNINVYKSLKQEGKPVALFNSFKGKWSQIRAQAVFSTIQFSDYDYWLLSRCFFIDLSHGHPIKDPGQIVKNRMGQLIQSTILRRINYFAIVASNFSKNHYHDAVDIPKDRIFISDFARNDVLFDETLRIGKNHIVDEMKKGRKAIVYMPTHRSDGKIKMNMAELLPLDKIQRLCEDKNYVFIIKKHYYHSSENEDLSNYSNIFDITHDDIDPQVLLYQADILISDYSACFIDYMLLRRPLVFYQYDYDYFREKERSFYIDFKEINIAPIAYKREELYDAIMSVISSGDSYLENRMKFAKEVYFDNINHNNACKKIKDILDSLMSGND